MQSGLMIIAEGTLSFVLPIGFAVYELRAMRRPWTPRRPPGGDAPPPRRPLPPELPPPPVAARARKRVLEDA